jgi:aryl-alcohol dehydrogenase-like predicted oxidoreductase
VRSTEYGDTGLVVSRLCFGTGVIGGCWMDFPTPAGARLLRYAHERGVGFWDTAETYDSHRHVAEALHGLDRTSVVINTKTEVKTHEEGRQSIDRALRELGTDYVDSMLLHAVKDPADLASRRACLDALLAANGEGKIRAVGVSTHCYSGPVMTAVIEHPDIEIILAHGNRTGEGLLSGSYPEHLDLLRSAVEAGKAVSIMKLLDGGKRPKGKVREDLAWGFEFPYAHAVNLGLASEEEVDCAVGIESEVDPPQSAASPG